jgi:3-phenylpropionate/trans-cinnamate dioxygenase ferredoxin subunit
VASIEVCPVEELPPGHVKVVHADTVSIGVYNLEGSYFALEDRCSHDDGPLCEGDWDPDEGVVVCPRHGANFDIRTGDALTLPAVTPVAVYPVQVVDGLITVELP